MLHPLSVCLIDQSNRVLELRTKAQEWGAWHVNNSLISVLYLSIEMVPFLLQ